MKIRVDYVTNSSSSSFVCFGKSKYDIEKNITKPDSHYLNLFKEYIEQNKNKEWFDLSNKELKEMDDDDKVKYMKDKIPSDYIDWDNVEDDIISMGGQEYDEVGIEPTVFIKKFPEEKIGDIKKITARELNKKFGTNFTEKDINYFESGWYDG
jgi:hypothetical protein